ncbi:ATP-binding protein [Streptomyces monticola]|uniref:ATP-binding protein n=1 Tax=Streptomyces monticola TaxID=2666263 RepID=A0ABW2JE64_9ACTN
MTTGISTYAGAAFESRAYTAASARELVSEFLEHLDSAAALTVTAEALGAARLVVTELVTNAIKYAAGPCVLELELTGDALTISVWDTDPGLPAPTRPDATRPTRHGLEIVQALCREVTVEQLAGGKRVRARLALA